MLVVIGIKLEKIRFKEPKKYNINLKDANSAQFV
jgi:hypothetical protein